MLWQKEEFSEMYTLIQITTSTVNLYNLDKKEQE